MSPWCTHGSGRAATQPVSSQPSGNGSPCEASSSGEKCDLYEREDDRAESVENRLNVYEQQTAPLIEYYRERGLLREIDGQRPQDEVYGQITAAIG